MSRIRSRKQMKYQELGEGISEKLRIMAEEVRNGMKEYN